MQIRECCMDIIYELPKDRKETIVRQESDNYSKNKEKTA